MQCAGGYESRSRKRANLSASIQGRASRRRSRAGSVWGGADFWSVLEGSRRSLFSVKKAHNNRLSSSSTVIVSDSRPCQKTPVYVPVPGMWTEQNFVS